ncbi:MAG: 3-oxoacyl-ACP reductase FabG [Burkholderiales bacterium]|nr:3-oxoacyl-ACP reductase FabG [Burkholderiales bacterium]
MVKRVLITGASRGIGKACAQMLSHDNWKVTVCASQQSPELDSLIEELSRSNAFSSALVFDIADPTASRESIEKDIDKNGAYWAVISNAGIIRDGAFPALSLKAWNDVINVDLNGFFNVVQPCVMPMISLRSGGRILAISSVSGIMGNRGQVNYSAAKAGLIGATKALAVELGKRAITVNCIAPGFIDTEMTKLDERVEKSAMDLIPLRRKGKPEEVASLVRFLLSDEASYITRQVISINGGMV